MRANIYTRNHLGKIFFVISICLFPRMVIGPLFIDDAYIFFRYVNNFTSGLGLVFNPAEYVLGASSPLYLLVLSGISGLGFPVTGVALWIGLVTQCGIALWIFALTRKSLPEWAAWVGVILFSVNSRMINWGVSGMETSLLLFLILSSIVVTHLGYKRWGSFLAGLVAITRPEGLLFSTPFLVYQVYSDRKIVFSRLLLLGSPLIVWLLFCKTYYGSWIPNSVFAKSIVYPVNPDPFNNFFTILRTVSDPLGLYSADSGPVFPILFFGIFVAFGFWGIFRSLKVSVSVLGWLLLLAMALSLTNRYLFPWYLAPFSFASVLVFPYGLEMLKGVWSKFDPNPHRIFRLLVITSGVVLFLFLIFGMVVNYIGQKNQLKIREQKYVHLGQMIHESLGDDYTLATVEIGALGFSYPGKIFDLTGLVSPEVLPYYMDPEYEFQFPHNIPPKIFSDYQPEILVAYDSFMQELFLNAKFLSSYRLAYHDTETHPYFGTLFIYLRNDLPEFLTE